MSDSSKFDREFVHAALSLAGKGEVDHLLFISDVAIPPEDLRGRKCRRKLIYAVTAEKIAQELIGGGARLGVSSRGTGNVNEAAVVSDFSFVTVDIVSQPSAPDAYPNVVQEALGSKKIMTLAEAVVHDKAAQKYLTREVLSLLEAIRKGAK